MSPLREEHPGLPRSPPCAPSPQPGRECAIVWAVCDVGGRTVKTFDYNCKADAEACMADLKARGKGTHFLRSLKEPINPDSK